jgi:hypothetical protein
VSVSVKGTTGTPNVAGTGASGSITGTASTSYTNEQDSSSSVALTTTNTFATTVRGPASPYVGVNHDYDIIWLWLNPLANFAVLPSSQTSLFWKGYSYDTTDVPEMDIYGVYLGWMNGHLSMTSADQQPLQRNWAAGQVWPAGQGPALTATDYAAIAAADPFSNPSFTVTVPATPAGNLTSSDGRFTLTGNQIIDYEQAAPGGQPFTQQLTESTTTTQAQGQGAKYTFQQGFSIEEIFKGSIFWQSVQFDLKQADTLTWAHGWSTTRTNASGTTATGSVTGPPCVVFGSGCNPTYSGATRFEVFQDNIYGTYLFYPVNN